MHRQLTRSILATTLVCITAACVHAASVSVESRTVRAAPGTPETILHTIRYTGIVESGDSAKLRAMLSGLQRAPRGPRAVVRTTMEMSSLGGDLLEGMQVGYLLREFEVATVVRKGDICLSSCALAFLGGSNQDRRQGYALSRLIEIGGKVGFHNFSLNPNVLADPGTNDPALGRIRGFNEARGGASRLFRYGLVMGIDPILLARIIGQPPEIFEYVDRTADFVGFAVCPAELSRPPLSGAEQATNICNNATGGLDPVSVSHAVSIDASQARRLLLELVQRNLLQSQSRGALAVQLASYSVMRDNEQKARLYTDLRAAGVPLPELVGPVYRVGGFQAGNYEMECLVSLSLEEPDRYDAVIIGPGGIEPPPRAAPQGCRRLFLYPINHLINPVEAR